MTTLQGLSLVLRVCLLMSIADTDAGAKTYVSPDGAHCFECPPGTSVKEHCKEDLTNSTCETCSTHYYNDEFSSLTHCKLCRPDCPKNSNTVDKCKHNADTVCICLEGFHMHPLDRHDPHWKCRPHLKCKSGQGEKQYGNHTHNTVCEMCTANQFVNTSDPVHPVCQDCRICEPGSKEIKNCSLDGDTQCADNSSSGYTVVSSTPPSMMTDSGSLSAGEIVGIVVGVLLAIIILLAIVIIFSVRKKEKQRGRIPQAYVSSCEVAALMEETTNSNNTHTANGEARRPDGAVPVGNGSNHPPSAGEGMETPGAGEMEMQELPSNPDSDWSEDFITRTVFLKLSESLGSEWSFFIIQLPGWPSPRRAQTIIEQKKEEERTVKGMIYGCLVEWKKECTASYFTKDSILQTLQKDGVRRNDLRDTLENMATS